MGSLKFGALATEVGDPAYVLNLVKRVVRVSLETVKIVKTLPPLEEITII